MKDAQVRHAGCIGDDLCSSNRAAKRAGIDRGQPNSRQSPGGIDGVLVALCIQGDVAAASVSILYVHHGSAVPDQVEAALRHRVAGCREYADCSRRRRTPRSWSSTHPITSSRTWLSSFAAARTRARSVARASATSSTIAPSSASAPVSALASTGGASITTKSTLFLSFVRRPRKAVDCETLEGSG